MRHRLPAGGWWLAVLFVAGLAAAAHAAPPDEAGVFDQLFGTDPAAERAGEASDGLALPSLFSAGRQLADTLPLHDLGSPAGSACVAVMPLLDALELAHAPTDGGIAITLPEPRRTIIVPQAALLPSPSGLCLKLADVPNYLPLTLTHDPVSQRLLMQPHAPLPVLMRLARAERQARLQPEATRPDFALQPHAPAMAQLWSADLALGMVHAANSDISAAVLASGELLGLAAQASLRVANRGPLVAGFTLSDARETPDLLGPLKARSLALGDIGSPAQPLIADALSGRGLVVSSRPPWRADLVDEIDLSGPLPAGWEAELWHEDRLVDVTRTADAAGNWRFTGLPVRIGENRWVIRLYGPHGESSEQAFTRLVGTEMNAENELDYAFGLIDGGTSLIGAAPNRTASGAAGFATIGLGLDPDLTARLDLRAPLAGTPAFSFGLHGAHAGGLWAATLARDSRGSLGGAVRIARRLGAQDLVLDLARHGRDAGPAQPPLVREFADLAAISGQGRLALGRHSLPWQLRLQSGTRRGGGQQQMLAARLALSLAAWQASASLGMARQSGTAEASGGWQGNAALGVSAGMGRWRLRSGLDALYDGRWRLGGATLSAARSTADGAISLDLGWQAASRRLGGGVSLNHRLGPVGLSAGVARGGDGWRIGLGLVVGLWQNGGRWQAAPAGLARSGAVLADMFIDDDGDGARDADEAGVAGGRFIVGAAVRGETTDAEGRVLLGALPAGPSVDVETQLSSLPDFALRPAHGGDRLILRPGEIRRLPIPLHATGSIEVQIVRAAGDNRSPLSGELVVLRDDEGREIARSVSDFEGYALFEGIGFGRWSVEAVGQTSGELTLSSAAPDKQALLLVPPQSP